MVFSSYEFVLLFVPLAVTGYFLLNHFHLFRLGTAYLLCMSWLYYSWWNPIYLPLLLSSIVVNYSASWFLSSERSASSRKLIFILGLVFNIGLLGYFKYADFFLENINWLSGSDYSLLHVLLPLGISFFTLQQVAFLVDAYEGLSQERNFLNYALFVSFFPQLVAGPIVHHQEMMPQFADQSRKAWNAENFAKGTFIFIAGLCKKVLIADRFSDIVSYGFDQSSSLNFIEAWFTSLCYTFQIYFDFSAYSDMAIGIGLMMNICLPINFNSPYKATSIRDFWSRWHITLSNFITTYVHTSIVRCLKRPTFAKTVFVAFIAMLISGVWHGAGWTYIVWGGFHGLALVIHAIWKRQKWKMSNFWAWVITFNFVNVANVIFRSKSLSDAYKVLYGMCGGNGIVFPEALSSFVSWELNFGHSLQALMISNEWAAFLKLLIVALLVLIPKNAVQIKQNLEPSFRLALFIAVAGGFAVLNLHRVQEFVYFQF